MFAKCKAEYLLMVTRLDQVIRDKWPETLAGDGAGVWAWAAETRAEAVQRLTALRRRLEVAWLNGVLSEVKGLTLEWGKLTLEIFKDYSEFLRKGEMA